jgi:hypothetical protein
MKGKNLHASMEELNKVKGASCFCAVFVAAATVFGRISASHGCILKGHACFLKNKTKKEIQKEEKRETKVPSKIQIIQSTLEKRNRSFLLDALVFGAHTLKSIKCQTEYIYNSMLVYSFKKS